jgi:hypothetical protein
MDDGLSAADGLAKAMLDAGVAWQAARSGPAVDGKQRFEGRDVEFALTVLLGNMLRRVPARDREAMLNRIGERVRRAWERAAERGLDRPN